MKKLLFIFLISVSLFIPKDVFAFNWEQTSPPFFPMYNLNSTITYSGYNLNVAQFYSFPAGNQLISVSGRVKNFEFKDNLLDPGQDFYLYFNVNLCTDTNYSIHTPNMIDHMYVYNSNQQCNFNGSNYKGHVSQIYFRIIADNQLDQYSGSFYLNASTSHSVELINYQANFEGFPINFTNDYTDDINELKDILSDSTTEQEKTNEKLDELNDNITNSDISGASDSAGGFFTDFENDDYGLSDIVTLPLTFIQGLANASCSDLELPLPFVDEDVLLPCMSAIYEDYFGPFLTIYQIITFGIVGYWVCVNTLRLVNNFKNPDNDEVEVMDL